MKTNNSLFVIVPWKLPFTNVWVFNDEARKITREPFVGGVNLMIDWLTREIPKAEDGFTLMFSAQTFPTSAVQLDHVNDDGVGNTYRCKQLDGVEGWLCPVLLQYFNEPPKQIFGAAVALERKQQLKLKRQNEKADKEVSRALPYIYRAHHRDDGF